MAQQQVTTTVARGKTFHGIADAVATAAADYVKPTYGGDLEGLEAWFPDTDPADPTKLRTNRMIRMILMRNQSGITMYKSRVVKAKSGYFNRRFDGYCCVTAEEVVGVIDDHLGSAGVRNGDLCWVAVEGPQLVYTSVGTAGFTGNTISEHDLLYALTAATSQATTSGRMKNWGGTFSAAETTDGSAGKIIGNRFARAISAATSGETNTQKLVDLTVKR